MLLLSLLGEQPIPNLLPLWHAPQYTVTQFAATRTTLPLAHALAEFIRHDPQLGRSTVLEPLELPAYDVQLARARLAEALATHQLNGQRVCLNLTGGTKLMSLAALQAAFGSGAQLMYVATEQNAMIYFRPDGSEERREPIKVVITAAQYLAAHGLEVSPTPNFGSGPVKPRHTGGDALEKQVEKLARKSALFDDVQRNLFIRKVTQHGPVTNELDVVVTRNGRFAVCSCKMIDTANARGRDMMREAIYEVASLSRREVAGIYCGKVLVNSYPVMAPAIIDRAEASGVKLVYGRDVARVAEYLSAATN